MRDKFPALEDEHTFIVQPRGGNIYLSVDLASRIGITRYKHDVNEEGAAILRRCTGLKSVKEIIGEICIEFDDVADAVEPKVTDFLKTAEEMGYIRIQDLPLPTKGHIKGSTDYVVPVRALVEITSACNLRCVHCYGEYGTPSKDELSEEQIITILATLNEMGTEGLNITGGETLLKDGLLEILDFCYKKFSFSLLTNGTLIDNDFSRRFAGYLDSPLQVSLYGSVPEDHEAVTGVPGSFKKTIEGIKSMVSHDVYVMIAYLYRPGNPEGILEMARFCADLGVSMFRVGSLVKSGRGKDLEWEISEEEFNQVSDLLKELRNEYRGKMEVQQWSPGGEMSLEEDEPSKKDQNHLKCHIGTHFIVIAPNGDVMPCGLIRWTYGNLLRDDPKELFSRECMQFFSKINAPSSLLCGTCAFLYRCRKCHAIALTNFYKVKECAWVAQFKDAPDIIKKNIEEARMSQCL
jgi:radical SAM protein with 4Fe4S-binding SPASM domain